MNENEVRELLDRAVKLISSNKVIDDKDLIGDIELFLATPVKVGV